MNVRSKGKRNVMKKNTIVVIAVCWMLVVVVMTTVSITVRFIDAVPADLLSAGIGYANGRSEDAQIVERYKRLEEVRVMLANRYYKELDEEDLVLGAIRGMLDAPEDPYTYYYTPEEHQRSIEMMHGTYDGLGFVLSPDDEGMLLILRVFPDTPAKMAGILPGDKIIKVNGNDVSGRTYQDMDFAIAAIKTAEDPHIALTLLRGNEQIKLTVARATIQTTRTEHRMVEGGIGYVIIHEFMGDDVSGFERAVNDLLSQGMEALVIDLRNNPGGMLQDVVSIADALLPEGLIVYTEDRAGRRQEYTSDRGALGIPMAVLVNGMSASASEVLSGALQDYGVATIIGETTFGKGIVQESVPFRDDGACMQLTVATYFTPSGRSIHGVGIVPDIEVSLPEDVSQAMAELYPERDAQLSAALQTLREQLNKP